MWDAALWRQLAETHAHISGRQKGFRKGLLRGIELGLEIKFGDEGLKLFPEIQHIWDIDTLQSLYPAMRNASNLAELYQRVRRLTPPPEASSAAS